MNIQLKELSKLGYTNNVARSLIVNIVSKHCKHATKEQVLQTLGQILETPLMN
jgi:tRNA-splicing ligase RtcB